MQINITRFFADDVCAKDYSASVAEIGENAGAYTWSTACADAPFFKFIDTPEKVEALVDFLISSGGWTEEELAEWTPIQLNAVFLQWIAGDVRECLEWDVDDVWANYQELAEKGTVPSHLFKDDTGAVWFDLSN